MENVSRMKELISRLNQAAKVYYQGQGEVLNMINFMMSCLHWKKKQALQ